MGRIWNCPCTTKSSPAARITLVPWASTTWEWSTMLTSKMMYGWVSICTVMSTLRALVRRVQTMWHYWLWKCCENWIFFAKIQLAVSWILFLITAPAKTKTTQYWSYRHGWWQWGISKRYTLCYSWSATQKIWLTACLTCSSRLLEAESVHVWQVGADVG